MYVRCKLTTEEQYPTIGIAPNDQGDPDCFVSGFVGKTTVAGGLKNKMPLSTEHTDVRDFLVYLRLKNLAPRTINEYQWVLKDLFRHCPPDLTTPPEVTFTHLRDYVAGLQARGLAAKTVSDRVIVVKRFFGYLLAVGRLTSDPSQRLPIPKVGKRLPKALTLAEMQAFFSTLSRDSRSARRDRVLFELSISHLA